MPGIAYVYMNFEQALRLGHVGWGFYLGDERYCFGSTDHLLRIPWWDVPAVLAYMHVPAGGDNDWWAEIGSRERMFEVMERGNHVRYHAYKELWVADPDPDRAIAVATGMREGGWSVLANNCVHQTYEVLRAYGVSGGVPDPGRLLTHIVPRRWFDRIASLPAFFSDLALPGRTQSHRL